MIGQLTHDTFPYTDLRHQVYVEGVFDHFYGMNFHDIPELGWRYGYVYIWALMYMGTHAFRQRRHAVVFQEKGLVVRDGDVQFNDRAVYDSSYFAANAVCGW